MFNSGDIIGRSVHVELFSSEIEKKFQGIRDSNKFEKVVGLDEHGVWLEDPEYDMEEGIDPITGKKITQREVYLIPWSYILSIVVFPDWQHPEKLPPMGFKRTDS